MRAFRRLSAFIAAHGSAALVTVHAARGSAPREPGARLVVRPDGAFHGTIGGGRLEWEMLTAARAALAQGRGPARRIEQALGPDLGQCCGGHVSVLVETFDARDTDEIAALADAEAQGEREVACRMEEGRVRRLPLGSPLPWGAESGSPAPAVQNAAPTPFPWRSPEGGGEPGLQWHEPLSAPSTPLLLFGAGHVGRALVLALAPLPFAVRWIDGREGAFPTHVPANATPVRTDDPEGEIARAPQDALVLVMTHDHGLDLAVTAAALRRGLPFVGLIGSATKRARFERRLRALGLPEARIRSLCCPIGLPGITGKEPAVIAAATVAQVLQVRENGAALAPSPAARERA